MAELATLARPYANAAFDIAKGESSLDQWSNSLGLLAAAVDAPVVQELLSSPDIEDDAKALRLADMFRDELNDRSRRFLSVLAENKRLELLPEIAEQYEVRRAEEEQSLDVEIISAYPLTDEQADKLKAALHRKYEREINLSSSVDAELMGGAVIRAGDNVIDGSVRGKLEKLRESLQRS